MVVIIGGMCVEAVVLIHSPALKLWPTCSVIRATPRECISCCSLCCQLPFPRGRQSFVVVPAVLVCLVVAYVRHWHSLQLHRHRWSRRHGLCGGDGGCGVGPIPILQPIMTHIIKMFIVKGAAAIFGEDIRVVL